MHTPLHAKKQERWRIFPLFPDPGPDRNLPQDGRVAKAGD
jgi:hypothetical protein